MSRSGTASPAFAEQVGIPSSSWAAQLVLVRRGMRSFTLLLALAACGDPLSPSATGTIDIAPSVDVTQYTRLVVEIVPTDDAANDASTLSDMPAPVSWPADFEVGGDVDPRPVATRYQVDAWLATAEGTTEPADGAPHASAAVGCCTVADIALVLAP